jgi:peptidoglycan pentaglycine glycine transferase (the first glycine)
MTMTRRVAAFSSKTERRRWNAFVTASSWGHLMQSWEWGDFKAALGWKVERIGIEHKGRIVAGAQTLFRSLPLLPLTVAYIPKGPIVDLNDEDTTVKLLSALHQTARSERAIFLKIEPHLPDDGNVHRILKRYGFRPSVHTNQPRSTIVINLSDGEDVVLANMRKKTRKLIRRAAREGVEIAEGEGRDIDDFYEMLKSTAEAKAFPIHRQAFYNQAWDAFRNTGAVKLLLAKCQGEVVAGKMMFVFGNRSMHLWGGTSLKGRDVYASYLLQWEAIKWAIARGCTHCDLWGIPDEVGELLKKGQDMPKDRRNGLWGVYMFKRGFGGEIQSYVGAYDYVYYPLLYLIGIKILMRSNTVDAASRWLESFQR